MVKPALHWLKGSAFRVLLIVLVGLGLFSFAGKRRSERPCKTIEVHLTNEEKVQFITQENVLSMLGGKDSNSVIGIRADNAECRKLEQNVRTDVYIKEAAIYADMNGTIHARVAQMEPIARIIVPNGPDQYIDKYGVVFPQSRAYAARVIVVHFPERDMSGLVSNFAHSEEGKPILELIKAISSNDFWKAMIAEIIVNKRGEISLYPQIGNQVIEFGTPEDFEVKLGKLRCFYESIVPVKGWDNYTRVKLQFNHQIICQ